MSFELDPQVWLTTPQAAKALGVHADTLKRWADREQILKVGDHYMFGPHKNSPRRWEITAIKQTVLKRRALGYSLTRAGGE